MQGKEIKRESQKIILNGLKTVWAAVDKPQSFISTDGDSKSFYSVTVVLDKKDENYKKLIDAFKKAAAGVTPQTFKNMVKQKLGSLTDNDLEYHEGLSPEMVKVTFKNRSKPKTYDNTGEKSVKSDEVSFFGGDIVNAEVIVKTVKSENRTVFGSYLQRIALVEKVARADFDNDADWAEANGVDSYDKSEDTFESDDEVKDKKTEIKEEDLDLDDFDL